MASSPEGVEKELKNLSDKVLEVSRRVDELMQFKLSLGGAYEYHSLTGHIVTWDGDPDHYPQVTFPEGHEFDSITISFRCGKCGQIIEIPKMCKSMVDAHAAGKCNVIDKERRG